MQLFSHVKRATHELRYTEQQVFYTVPRVVPVWAQLSNETVWPSSFGAQNVSILLSQIIYCVLLMFPPHHTLPGLTVYVDLIEIPPNILGLKIRKQTHKMEKTIYK